MMSRKKVRIGDLLVQNGVITDEQLMTALAEQKKSGRKLGRTLIELHFITEDQLLTLLSRQLQVPFIELKQFNYKADIVRLLPETFARRFRAVVLDEKSDHLLLAMADPTDIYAFDEISRLLKRQLRLAVARESDLLGVIGQVYRKTEAISSLASELHEELAEDEFDLAQIAETNDAQEAPVAKLLKTIFEDALQVNCSDIHIEPDEHVLRIRLRVDGVLQEQEMKETRIAPALVVRLKLMCGLDISEKRLPQDGRFNIRVGGRNIDVRLSTLPIQHGESVVMRLLDQSAGILNLEEIGMAPAVLEPFRRHTRRPHGIVLVTGPTGSGKTTTLYAALSELNQADKKIITVEDPVEYRLPRINQVQINPKAELTFARVLRAALRQDPDIVLVGEIRDQETAQIALRAAMTGHLVLSTLHTNDAITTANRLLDMGCEGYLVAASLQAIVAQRLVRRICDNCAVEHQPDEHQTAWLHAVDSEAADTGGFRHGSGCPHCNNTGYKGRIGLHEFLEIDGPMAEALRCNDTAAFVRAAKSSTRYRSLASAGLEYARQGVTTLEEVIRVSGEGIETAEAPLVLEQNDAPAED